MTYFELGNFLEKIIREYEFSNIKNIDSKVIKKYIENDNGELANFVFFRAQQIEDISKQAKTGTLTIRRNRTKTTLTLITCTNNDSTTQTIYVASLVNVS